MIKQRNGIKPKIKKRMIRFLSVCCALLICFGMIPAEGAALAADEERSCSLTLYYTRNDRVFTDLDIDIYRVAKADDSGEYKLVEPFSAYPINIQNISSAQEWQNVAQTVRQYVIAEKIEAYRSGKTDGNGRVFFDGLEPGLYMVKGVTARSQSGTVDFYDFMIYLPVPAEGGSGYDYDVEAKPKSTERPDSPDYPDHPQHGDPVTYTVVKLWDDAGVSDQRPESVQVEILRDGVLQQHVMLNSANNWTYSWQVTDRSAEWSVMELNVPEGYLVTISGTETRFTITNAKASIVPSTPDKDQPEDGDDIIVPGDPVSPEKPGDKPGESPKTGDTAPMLRYVILMCLSGLGLMIMGFMGQREGRHEKSR